MRGDRGPYGDGGVPVDGWGLMHRVLQFFGDSAGRVAILHNWHVVLP